MAAAAEIDVVTDEVSVAGELGLPTVVSVGGVFAAPRRRRMRRRTVGAGSRGGDVAAAAAATTKRWSPASVFPDVSPGDDVLVGGHTD